MAEDEDLAVLGAVIWATGDEETGEHRTMRYRRDSIGASYDAA